MSKLDYSTLPRWKDFTLEEFKNEIDIGMDINIFIGNDLFWLGVWDDGMRIISQCPDGQVEGIYKDAEDMLEHFIYKGKTLREHFPDIEFTRC